MNINQFGGFSRGERVVEPDTKMHGVVVDIDGDQIVMKGDDHETYKHVSSHFMKEDEYNAAHPGEQKSISSLVKYMIISTYNTYIFKRGKTIVSSPDDFEQIFLNKLYLVQIMKSLYGPTGIEFQVKFLYGEYKDRLTVGTPSDHFVRFKYLNMRPNQLYTDNVIIRGLIVLLVDITNEINIKNFSLNEYRDIHNTLKQFIALKL